MIDISFSENIKALEKRIYDVDVKDLKADGLLWTYLIVSCNLSIYRPDLDEKEHFRIIQDIQFNRALSSVDLLYPSLLDNLRINDKHRIVEKSKETAHIFVSYHTGPYNLFLRHLVHEKTKLCVVANLDYIKDHESTIQNLYKYTTHNPEDSLEIMPAEDPKLLLKLTKRLKSGISVFIFIDGNSGVKKEILGNDKNLLKIDFLNHHIYARQGVGYLSYLSKSPVVTVLSSRKENIHSIIDIAPVIINKANGIDRQSFISSTTKKLYRTLEVFLNDNYKQWAGWLYIHKLFEEFPSLEGNNFSIESYSNKYVIIDNHLHLIDYNNNYYIISRRNYKVKEITKYLFDLLKFFSSKQKLSSDCSILKNNQKIDAKIIEELIDLRYINQIL